MLILRGYKTELQLNNRQRTLCIKHAGCARFAYNWGLQRKIEEYGRKRKSPNAMALHRELNRLKPKEFPWMYEVSKRAPQEALRNLDRAFQHFFRQNQQDKSAGFPKFKSRKKGYGSFRLTGPIRVFENAIQLPRLRRLRLKESRYLPSESSRVHILSATVSKKARRWFVSLQGRENLEVQESDGPVLGIDVGIKFIATASDGTVLKKPFALQRFTRKLRRTQRSHSHKIKGGKNRAKVSRKLQKIHARIVNIRKDALHKATTKLAKTKSVIVVESLNVKGMLKNQFLAKALVDATLSEFRRQLECKTRWYGSRMFLADRFYPSSKKCSLCGNIKEDLPLSTRVYRCEVCGLAIDRDLNASYNLAAVAASSAETINAWSETEGYSSIRAVSVSDTGTKHGFI
jgi:putative transposase